VPAIPLDGFYESETLPLPAQECVNWYRVISTSQADVSPVSLSACSGISQEFTTGAGSDQVNRGMHIKNGKPYFLNGTTLYRIDMVSATAFQLVTMGTILGEGRVSMADNGTQLMVLVPGGDGYIINEDAGTVFQQITDLGFTANGAPQIVVFMDSFFICSTDSKTFIRCDANNGLSWNSLNRYTAESDPDDISSLVVFNNKLYVGGSETIEEFYNNAGSFQRTGLFLDKGVTARFTMIAASGTMFWIGGGTDESPAIWMLSGSSPVKISTTMIDKVLQDYSLDEIVTAFSYSYAKAGAAFVGFSLPTRTFEYNAITGKWNERKSKIVDADGNAVYIRFRVNSLGTAYNKVWCGDSQDGRIGVIESDTYSEYGNEILRTCVIQPLTNEGRSLSITNLEPTFQSGVGTVDIPEPQIRFAYCKNSGDEFSNETSRSLGGRGEYQRRTIWTRLGRFPREALFRFTMTDKVESEFIKLEFKAAGGQ